MNDEVNRNDRPSAAQAAAESQTPIHPHPRVASAPPATRRRTAGFLPARGEDLYRRSAVLVRSLARLLHARVVETHISWVLVGEEHAWKIKKPVRTPFLDYSTLRERERQCLEELRVNERFAPGLYDKLERIGGTPQAPLLGARGPALEVAVRMHAFREEDTFSSLLEAGSLADADVEGLAAFVAGFQATSARARPSQGFGLPSSRKHLALAALHGASVGLGVAATQGLQSWLEARSRALSPLWRTRLADGFVREGHGDLHLGNLLRLQPGATSAFDAVEFDPQLRWTDVIDEIAFPFMDLAAHGRADLAWTFLSRWLDITGDHAGLPALRFAATYRALVRCTAAVMRGQRDDMRRYAGAAAAWSNWPVEHRGAGDGGEPSLTIMHGLPGSGKTTRAGQLMRAGAMRIRSDVERKRLHGVAELQDSAAAGLDIYTGETTRATYERLMAAADAALSGGLPVVLDAAFLQREWREIALALARRHGVQFAICSCEAPEEVLRERLRARSGDASEAREATLEKAMKTAQPLDSGEKAYATVWQPGAAMAVGVHP